MTTTAPYPQGFRLASRVRRSPALMFSVAAISFVAAVLNGVGMAGFPRDEVVERLYAIGITVDLIAITAILTIVGAITAAADRVRAESSVGAAAPETVILTADGGIVAERSAPRATIAALVGTVFGVVSWALWLALSGSTILFGTIVGARVSYLDAAAAGFYFGVLWVLATVFGAVGLHRGGGARNLKLSIAAIALGVGLMVPLVTLSLLHGTGVVG